MTLMTHVGVTGTKEGGTKPQLESLYRASRALTGLVSTRICLHHGDCQGIDSEMHDIATELGWRRIIHPPILSKYRAFRDGDQIRNQRDYLSRNKDIVDESEVIFACPRLMFEELRSGTWHAIRYSRKKNKRRYLFWPDGTVTMENAQ